MDSEEQSCEEQSCACGRDGGDGGTRCCDRCKRWHCSNMACNDHGDSNPWVVETVDVFLCVECMEDNVVFVCDKSENECQICGTHGGWHTKIFSIANKDLCLNCLKNLVESSLPDDSEFEKMQ